MRQCGFTEQAVRAGRSIFSFAMSQMRTKQTLDQQLCHILGMQP
jgi:hypothetical protein